MRFGPTDREERAELEGFHQMLLRRVSDMLEARPDLDLAVVADDEAEAGAVLVAVARRNSFACLLKIEPARHDGARLLELIEQHSQRTIH